MKRLVYIIGILLLLLTLCTCKKSPNTDNANDIDSVAVMDSMRPDMPPPPPDSDGVDGHRPPPPPHGKGHPPHKQDNMRGFDPASEDDMDDNGMSRYMENNDEEGWD